MRCFLNGFLNDTFALKLSTDVCSKKAVKIRKQGKENVIDEPLKIMALSSTQKLPKARLFLLVSRYSRPGLSVRTQILAC